MKKILLAITIFLSLLLVGCGKGEPYEEIKNYHQSSKQYIVRGYKKNGVKEGIETITDLETNNILCRTEFKNGVPEGSYESYIDGKLYCKGNNKNGKSDGLVTVYESDGKTVLFVAYYENGKFVKIIED